MLLFLFLNYWLLIAAVIAEIFNLITELVIPIGIPSKEAKTEVETHPVILKAEIRMCSI